MSVRRRVHHQQATTKDSTAPLLQPGQQPPPTTRARLPMVRCGTLPAAEAALGLQTAAAAGSSGVFHLQKQGGDGGNCTIGQQSSSNRCDSSRCTVRSSAARPSYAAVGASQAVVNAARDYDTPGARAPQQAQSGACAVRPCNQCPAHSPEHFVYPQGSSRSCAKLACDWNAHLRVCAGSSTACAPSAGRVSWSARASAIGTRAVPNSTR